MNGNKSTYKYHPYITNIFCSGGASSYKTEAFFVSLPFRKVVSISGKYLSDALKMCADYLDIQIIRLLSLSLPLSLSLSWLRASIYKIFLKYQSLTESPFSGISLLSTLLSEPLHAALTNRGRVSSYPSAVYAGAWNNNARIRRRYAFLLTRNNKSYQI